MLHLKNSFTTKDLEGFTVIVPSFTIVNAAQLATDVLIASKQMVKIGEIFDDSLVPIFGHSAFEHSLEERASACEIYADKKSKLLVIQFRTVMVLEYGLQFHKKLAKMLKDLNVERIIVISYAVKYEQEGSPLQYEASEAFKKAFKADLDAVKWQEYAKAEIMGGGNDKLLYKIFEKQELPVMIMHNFVAFPTVEEKVIFNHITELVKNLLKAEQGFNLTLPIGWKSLIENETKEMMY